jgi:hypothetical protein
MAVRQRQDEQGRLLAGAGADDLGAAEIALGLAGRVEQGHEDFRLGLLRGRDGGADDAGAGWVVVRVAEAFVDASGAVPLLGRGVPVGVEDLVDDRDERAQDRLGAERAGAVKRRFGVVDDLAERAEVQPILGARLAQAQFAVRTRRRISDQSSMLGNTPASRG